MKRRILIIIMLTFFITLLNAINSYAEIVEKEYEGDKGYGIKYVHMDAKGKKYPKQNLNIIVKNESQHLITSTARIDKDKITISGDLHVGDSIYLEFVWLAGQWGIFGYYSEPVWTPKTENIVVRGQDYTHERSGRNHTKAHATLDLKGSGNGEVNVHINDGLQSEDLTISIQNIYSVEAKADDTALKKQKELEATSGLRGFKKSDNLHFISDVKEATAIQITSGMILTRSDVIDQIKYSESKNPEYTSYTKSSVAKVAQTENIVVMEENMSVLCYTHTYHAGKKDFGWGYKNLIAGHEYTIRYTFVHYSQIDELWYRVTYDDNTIGDTADGDKATELDDDLFKDISDAEDEVTGIMKAVVSKIGGEKRVVYDEFHDVLSDAGYYTKIKDIDSNDSKEVEQNVAKIVATVANVGMSLSIIIPALLGVKYMISSAEDKADYKKDLVPYFVGALLLFSICTFVKILQTIGNKINEI